ncbi:MAG: hypothetical protein ACKVN9_07500 [Methylophilaceae bacterium]
MAENPKPAPSKAVVKLKVAAAKPAAKAATATPVKKVPVKKLATKPVAPKAPAKKTAKPVKVKMVRDSFSMPAPDHALLVSLKKSCQDNGRKVKKSDLLCAGVGLLAKLSSADLLKALK